MDSVIIYDKLEELNEGIEYYGGGILSPVEDIASNVTELQGDVTTLLGKGCVKSVQRGTAYGIKLSTNIGSTHSIGISTVNVQKSVLIAILNVGGDGNLGPSITVSLNSSGNAIVCQLYGNSGYTTALLSLSWQLIEFY